MVCVYLCKKISFSSNHLCADKRYAFPLIGTPGPLLLNQTNMKLYFDLDALPCLKIMPPRPIKKKFAKFIACLMPHSRCLSRFSLKIIKRSAWNANESPHVTNKAETICCIPPLSLKLFDIFRIIESEIIAETYQGISLIRVRWDLL